MTNEEKTEGELFKIKGIGIDTTTIDYKPSLSIDNAYSYFYTDISSNNDYLVSELIGKLKSSLLVTGIDFLDNAGTALIGHLEKLSRDKVDILLVESSCDFVKYGTTLLDLFDLKLIKSLGIKNPKDVESLSTSVNYLNTLGINVNYVALDICPLNFNLDIINWCKENNIIIIGFNPFGGYISAANVISCFSAPYLLEFISTYSDIVFLSGRDLYNSSIEQNYLSKLIGKSNDSVNRYILKKNVSKLDKPLKKLVNTSIYVSKNIILPYNSPELLFNPIEEVLTINPEVVESFEEVNKDELTDIEKLGYDIFESIHIPEDGSDSDMLSILRYRIISNLESSFKKYERWNIKEAKLGDKIFLISCVKKKKKWLFFTEEEQKATTYILYYNNGKFLFRNYEIANLTV